MKKTNLSLVFFLMFISLVTSVSADVQGEDNLRFGTISVFNSEVSEQDVMFNYMATVQNPAGFVQIGEVVISVYNAENVVVGQELVQRPILLNLLGPGRRQILSGMIRVPRRICNDEPLMVRFVLRPINDRENPLQVEEVLIEQFQLNNWCQQARNEGRLLFQNINVDNVISFEAGTFMDVAFEVWNLDDSDKDVTAIVRVYQEGEEDLENFIQTGVFHLTVPARGFVTRDYRKAMREWSCNNENLLLRFFLVDEHVIPGLEEALVTEEVLVDDIVLGEMCGLNVRLSEVLVDSAVSYPRGTFVEGSFTAQGNPNVDGVKAVVTLFSLDEDGNVVAELMHLNYGELDFGDNGEFSHDFLLGVAADGVCRNGNLMLQVQLSNLEGDHVFDVEQVLINNLVLDNSCGFGREPEVPPDGPGEQPQQGVDGAVSSDDGEVRLTNEELYERLNEKYEDYQDDYEDLKRDFEFAESARERDRTKTNLRALFNDLEDLDEDIDDLQEEDLTNNLEKKLKRLEKKVGELKGKIRELLNPVKKELESVDEVVEEKDNVVENNLVNDEKLNSNMQTGKEGFGEASYLILLGVGSLVVLVLVIVLLFYLVRD